MRDLKQVLADKIRRGEHVALYCYGILASHMLCSLEKFYGVLPTVIIDNAAAQATLLYPPAPVI